MRKALLLVNRNARRGETALAAAINLLKNLEIELIEESITDASLLSDLIRRYHNQVDLVIIGGGDGTLNSAIDGLFATGLPLGILPLGTANDLARTLGLTTNLVEACQVIANGKTMQIDVGKVNDKYFFNVASLGLSVEITQKLTQAAKRRWGILAYAATTLQVIWQSRPFRAEILIPGETLRVRTIQIAIGNGRHYGGGMVVAADAAIDDQRLDLYSLETKQWWQILALLPTMRRGNHAMLPGVRVLHGQEFEIRTFRPRPINTDGEITTHTPARFSVIPKALKVFVADYSNRASLN